MSAGVATSLKITHFGVDSQFMAFVSEVFEAVAPGSNEYVIEDLAGSGDLRFPIRQGRVRIVAAGVHGLADVRSSVRTSNMVIAHSMGIHGAFSFFCAAPGTVKVWSGWGGDYCGSDVSRDSGLLGAKTLELSSSLSTTFVREFQASKGRLRGLIRREAARRADYFSAPIPEDYNVFRQRFPQFNGDYAQIGYASVEDTFALGQGRISGNDILVGNSSSFANNHLETLDALAQHDTSGRKIITPLSYGESKDYRAAVMQYGTQLFGSDFVPLVDFLPMAEYVALVANCNIVIMGHKRQQALGNIGAALYHGAHVFLDESNPTMEFFRNRGAVVRSMTELRNGTLPTGPVGPDALEANRRVLNEFWGRQKVLADAGALIALCKRPGKPAQT